MVDATVLDGLEDRVARLAMPPLAPADEQRALRVRMGGPYLAEQVASGAVLEPLAGEDEREQRQAFMGSPGKRYAEYNNARKAGDASGVVGEGRRAAGNKEPP